MAEQMNFITALSEFRRLPKEVRENVVSALQAEGPAMSIKMLADSVAKDMDPSTKEIIFGLLNGIGNMVPLLANDETFRASMTSWMVQPTDGTEVSEEDKNVLAAQLDRLFRCEKSIGTTAKAQSIMWGHGKVFHEAHVITQVRPIFFNDVGRVSESAVIVHELRLGYKEGTFESSFCITLDEERIITFRKVLDRAIEKERSLRKHPPCFAYLSKSAGIQL